jgi:hypothetical protein
VAVKAVFRKDGPDVPVEADFALKRGGNAGSGKGGQRNSTGGGNGERETHGWFREKMGPYRHSKADAATAKKGKDLMVGDEKAAATFVNRERRPTAPQFQARLLPKRSGER